MLFSQKSCSTFVFLMTSYASFFLNISFFNFFPVFFGPPLRPREFLEPHLTSIRDPVLCKKLWSKFFPGPREWEK